MGVSVGGCIHLLGLPWPSPTDCMVNRSNLFSPGSGDRESMVSTGLVLAEGCEGRTCPPPLSLACGRPSSPSICAGPSLCLCLRPRLPVLTTLVILEEQEVATHSSVLAWRIPGMGEPGGLLSMGSHRVGRDWSNLAAAAAAVILHQASSWEPHLNLKKIFNFNWRIIALQYCVGFCQTTIWIGHRYTYVPSSFKLNYLFRGSICKYILRYWALGLQCRILARGGGRVCSITAHDRTRSFPLWLKKNAFFKWKGKQELIQRLSLRKLLLDQNEWWGLEESHPICYITSRGERSWCPVIRVASQMVTAVPRAQLVTWRLYPRA